MLWNKVIEVVILTTFLLQIHVYCQNVEENDTIDISSTTSAPVIKPTIPIIPISVTIQSSSIENTVVPTHEVFTTSLKKDINFPNAPTVLHEARLILPTKLQNRDRNRHQERIPNNLRGRNSGRNRNSPDKFLRRIVGLGSRFIARSLSLFTGDEVSESTENKFKDFENPEFSSAVGSVQNSQEESLNDKLRKLNPVQLLLSRFMIRRNKMRRWREVKDNYRRRELERRVDFYNDKSGDFVARNVRNVVRSLVNVYEKNTDTMELWVDYRKQKLQRFLEIPLVASVLRNNTIAETNNTVTASTSQSVEDEEKREIDDIGNYDDNNVPFNPIAEISRKFIRFIQNI